MKKIKLLMMFLYAAHIIKAQAPVITTIIPSSGPIGTLVTITGVNLGNPTAFLIGGTTALVVADSGTKLVGLIMPGAITGSISITTGSGNVVSNSSFTITPTPYPNGQQDNKLVGTGVVGQSAQGKSVAISSDGKVVS